jgi:hypothetical protein
MATYDPKIVQKYADSLYSCVYTTIAGYALLGGLVGWIGATFVFESQRPRVVVDSGTILFIAIVCGLLGALTAQAKPSSTNSKPSRLSVK